MTNYVIINGVNSNTINGLGINELPPITKPQMRAMQEEIDGRDGDITTNLGYSAYDKTITIGLFGTGYDINDIVAFFNGEGTIVFSNEADKYYNFKILNQIDYVALQKFKSASITFHCQPFKYPLTETPLEIEYTYIEDEGESLTLNNTGEATLKLNLKGNTSQTGTPTPTSPIPVSVVSGDNEITISNSDNTQSQTYEVDLDGKNLFNKDEPNVSNVYLNTTGVISNADTRSFYLPIKGGNTYTIQRNGSARLRVGTTSTIPTNGTAIIEYQQNDTENSATITTSSTANYLICYFYATFDTNTKTYSEVLDTIQVEKGSTATQYEAYTTPLELCKIGDYQDYFTKNSTGQWCKYNAIGKVVLDGSETGWGYYSTYFYLPLNTLKWQQGGYRQSGISNRFIVVNRGLTNNGEMNLTNQSTSGVSEINLRNDDYNRSTINDFKTWLSNNNVSLYYPTTPYLSLIEDNNLIEQLDNIQNAMSYHGTTNISQVNNDKPFIISVKAVEEGTNEVVVNNIGNVYSKPLIALEGSGNVDIYLDNTQILKANVEDKMNIDIAKLEAYNPDTSALLNRQVIGNYNTMTLQPGENTIRIDGALDKATISNYTRWL